MSVIARRVKAIPERSASEAWAVIVQLLAPQADSSANKELSAVAGVACSLIADEAMKSAPIVVHGSGPRVRIYCLYDEDAMTGDNANETALTFTATEGDWEMSLPCPVEDLTWVRDALKKHSTRITARDLTSTIDAEQTESQATAKTLEIDEEAFFRQ